jgi:hypothetical protein
MTAKLIALRAGVAAPPPASPDTAFAAWPSKLDDPSVSQTTSRRMSYTPPREAGERQIDRSALRGTPRGGGARRAWRDLPGVTPPQIRERQ